MLPERIGPYRIEGLLGRGGMGEVYRAWDEQLGRSVAIKQIRAEELADPTAVKRFWLEARSTASLLHPTIVRIYHTLSQDDLDYIVMELVEGRTLAEVLGDGPLPPQRAAALFRDIAQGLAEAHAQGIVHRDLKAENIMVTPEGGAKILDFGLAKRLEVTTLSLSQSGTIIGTLHTMSPEQAQGEKVDHRSDLFSLGAVLYQTLTGVAPFAAKTVPETLAAVCLRHPRPVAQVDPAIPRELSDLIVRLLEKDRENRPRSAAEVAAELGRIADSGAPRTRDAAFRTEPTPAASQIDTLSDDDEIPRRGRGGRIGYLLAALGASVLLAFSVWVLWLPVRPAVAVLGFDGKKYTEHDDDWMGTAIGEMLIAELEAGDQIRVVSGDRVARARARSGLMEWSRRREARSAGASPRRAAGGLGDLRPGRSQATPGYRDRLFSVRDREV